MILVNTNLLILVNIFSFSYSERCKIKLCSYLTLSFLSSASSMTEVMEGFIFSPTLLRVIRVFRVGRVLRLVKSAKGIRTLLFSMAVSLPALFNIGLLLALVMFIYAVMGMNFFKDANLEYGLDDIFNFMTFSRSFILLFQMCTSAGWSDVLNGLIDKCEPDGPCADYTKATIYLATYLVVSFLVVVNMYIAVILENFTQATEDEQQGLTPDDFDMYYEKWEKYDPKATKYIPLDQLSDFVDYLDDPLKLPKPNHFILVKLDIPICEGDRCYCKDILDALTKNFLGTSDTGDIPAPEEDKDQEEYIPISSTLRRQKEHYAARIIQKAYRSFKGLVYVAAEVNREDSCSKMSNDGNDDNDSGGGGGSIKGNGENGTVGDHNKLGDGDDKKNSSDGSKNDRKDSNDSTNQTQERTEEEEQRLQDSGIVIVNETDVDPKTVELGPNSGVVA